MGKCVRALTAAQVAAMMMLCMPALWQQEKCTEEARKHDEGKKKRGNKTQGPGTTFEMYIISPHHKPCERKINTFSPLLNGMAAKCGDQERMLVAFEDFSRSPNSPVNPAFCTAIAFPKPPVYRWRFPTAASGDEEVDDRTAEPPSSSSSPATIGRPRWRPPAACLLKRALSRPFPLSPRRWARNAAFRAFSVVGIPAFVCICCVGANFSIA